MSQPNDINVNGLHLRRYPETSTNSGRVAHNVWMDQYGRIFENSDGEWKPTGECGNPNHY